MRPAQPGNRYCQACDPGRAQAPADTDPSADGQQRTLIVITRSLEEAAFLRFRDILRAFPGPHAVQLVMDGQRVVSDWREESPA